MRILPYHLSKSAAIQMCRNFACELAPKGIRVNSISPAFMKTKRVSVSSHILPTGLLH